MQKHYDGVKLSAGLDCKTEPLLIVAESEGWYNNFIAKLNVRSACLSALTSMYN